MMSKLFPWGLAFGLLALMVVGCDDDNHPCATCPRSDPAEAAALDYIETHRAELGLRDEVDEVVPYRVQEDDLGMIHVRCHQFYKGVRVWGGEMIVHLNAALEVVHVSNGMFLNVVVDVKPVISRWTAGQTARNHFHDDGYLVERGGVIESVVFRWLGGDYLCWSVVLRAMGGVDKREYFVDAHTGEIIYWRSSIIS